MSSLLMTTLVFKLAKVAWVLHCKYNVWQLKRASTGVKNSLMNWLVRVFAAIMRGFRVSVYCACAISLVPRLLPCRKTGREPGRSDHVPRHVLCVVLCVVLTIELLPTQSILSVTSGTVHCSRCWSSESLDVAETTDDGHWKAVSLLSS